jgi:hypothetical protein
VKRTIIAAAILALGTAGAGVSLADPEPNGHNNYGLCKAYTAQQDHRPGGANDTFTAMADAYDGEVDGDTSKFEDDCATLLGQPAPGNSDGKGKKGS